MCTGWTPENLQRLFSAMKKNISNQGREKSYIKGIKNVKWETVAFPPFSPSQCKEKWMDVFRTVRLCLHSLILLVSNGNWNPLSMLCLSNCAFVLIQLKVVKEKETLTSSPKIVNPKCVKIDFKFSCSCVCFNTFEIQN